jgi:hypothetical protein
MTSQLAVDVTGLTSARIGAEGASEADLSRRREHAHARNLPPEGYQ